VLLRRPLALRAYLLLLVFGAVAPGALLTSILVSRSVDANRAALERRLLDAARVDAAALDREFEGTIRALQALATSPALGSGDLASFYTEAKRVQQAQASWYTVVVLSLDGRQLLNTVRQWGEALPAATEPESVNELVRTRRPVVGRVRLDPRVPSTRRFAVRVPVMPDGELTYVLTAAITTESLGTLVHLNKNAAEEWTRVILDPDGAVAARSRDALIGGEQPSREIFSTLAARSDEVVRHKAPDGSDVYAAISRTAFGWSSLVLVPAGVLDAAAQSSTAALLIGSALLMTGGLLAAFGISRRLQREFTSAEKAATALAHGEPIAVPPSRLAEGQRLRESLERAATLLQQRQRERDAEVERAEKARAEAEEANRTKDHFLAVLGHELRNPLAPAITALELMKRANPDVFPRERQVLERQLSHMVRLVDDLLDVSRLSSGKMQLQLRRFELNDAVTRALDMVRALIERCGHTLRVAVPSTGLLVDADEDRIVQVLVNLLVNAAKYTPPGGHIWLDAHRSDGSVTISCADDGPGVPPNLLPRLFQPFAQGPRTLDRQHGGLGLGLALAHNLTERHGGTLHVESRAPEPGSRFVVRLPLASGDARTESDPRSDAHRIQVARRILIVDDSADVREMLSVALEAAGQVVATAADGVSALATAASFHPDVGILDIGLPGMNGHELAVRLRADHPRMRLISLTGFGQPSDAEAAARAGFEAHLVKPVKIDRLLEEIEPPGVTIE
jgi:signal transduction histidine kinase